MVGQALFTVMVKAADPYATCYRKGCQAGCTRDHRQSDAVVITARLTAFCEATDPTVRQRLAQWCQRENPGWDPA